MPPFLRLLLFVEMWERFSYYGMRSLLVLFLTKSFGFTDPQAYAMYSLFAALGYAGPVIGGFLADRLLGFRRMVILGATVMAIGHGLMALVEVQAVFLYIGLACIAVGTGLFKGNITNLLGVCYTIDDPDRDRGFTLFYVSVNLGSVLASLGCGLVGETYGWHYGFGLAGIGMVAGLFAFLRLQHVLGDKGLEPAPERLQQRYAGLTPPTWVYIGATALVLVCSGMLTAAETYSKFLSLWGFLILGVLIYILYNSTPEQRRGLLTLFLLLLFFTAFFALEMQLGSLINLFTDRNVDKTILGYDVPSSFSQAINPFSIIVLGPFVASLFARLNSKWSIIRFGGGLLTMCISFLILYFSCSFANAEGKVPYIWLFCGISAMGLGELCIAPAIQSYFSLLSPEKWRGFLMGVLMLSLSYANLAGLIISKFMAVPQTQGTATDALGSLLIYREGFYQIMLFNLAVTVLFFALVPLIRPTFDALRK